MKNTNDLGNVIMISLFLLVIYWIFVVGIFVFVILLLFICFYILFKLFWFFYKYSYYKSEKFLKIKYSISEYIEKCNELNEHIEDLKNTYADININHIDYGQADYRDESLYNYKRPMLKEMREKPNVYNCSLNVCSSASQQPFKYLCKYFNINIGEETLSKFEVVLNNFSAAEQGKLLLESEKYNIMESINQKIPYLIKKYDKIELIRKLGFNDIDFSQLYFPKYIFKYISPGGNSSMQSDIIFDVKTLDSFIKYLSYFITFKNSIAGQRLLMTSSLREKIKRRDNNTCKNCGLSTRQEPNLLLEIDHIIPLSKNGITSEENLQTLCWKCNRTKGAKIQ